MTKLHLQQRFVNVIFLLMVVWFAGSIQYAYSDVMPGDLAPDFTLSDTHGAERSLAEFKGKFIVLEWFNRDCPFVRKHYGSGNMQALQKKYTDQGIAWLSIISSAPGKQGYFSAEEHNQNAAEFGAHPAAVLMDPEGTVGKTYGAKTTPHMYIIDPRGSVIYQGAIDDIASTNVADIPKAKNFVQAALDEAMAGRPVSTPISKPYGCSVKYA